MKHKSSFLSFFYICSSYDNVSHLISCSEPYFNGPIVRLIFESTVFSSFRDFYPSETVNLHRESTTQVIMTFQKLNRKHLRNFN